MSTTAKKNKVAPGSYVTQTRRRGDMPRTGEKTPLREWMEANNVGGTEFARRTGCSRRSVYQWLDGQNLPSLVVALVIERETEGAVPVESWLETYAGRQDYLRLNEFAKVRQERTAKQGASRSLGRVSRATLRPERDDR